jgi:PHD/YefM family antitoxin component YafN of YafNO toxin-antitoxin module
MRAITFEYARENLEEVLGMANLEGEGVVIVHGDKNFVLIDKEMLDSIFETIELSRDKEFVDSLKRSEEEIKKGEFYTYEDIFGHKV